MRLARKSLCQQLNLLLCQFQLLRHDPRDIAARSRKAFDVSTHNRIKIEGNHYDRNRLVCGHDRLECDCWSDDDDQFRLRAHQFFRTDGISARIIFDPAKLDTEVLALAEAKLPHLREKGPVVCDRRRTGLGGAEVTDPIDLSDFLRACSERNRRHTAEQTYEFAPPHIRPRGSGQHYSNPQW